MSLRTLSLCWCVLMCTVVQAKAHEVQVGLEQGLEAQSNVLKSTLNPQPDGLYRITPTITFAQPESDFTYDLEYRPTYSAYFTTPGINGFDHRILGRGRYQVDGRNAIAFNTEFIRVRAIRSDNFNDASGQPLVVASDEGKNQRFVANLSLERSLSQRTLASATLNYNRWDYIESNNVNNQGAGIQGQLTHARDARLILGVNAEGRYRAFEETQFAPASFTTVVNFNALATYNITEKLTLNASGGPAGVFTRQSVPQPRFVSRWNGVAFDFLNCNPGPCGRLWNIGANPVPPCGVSSGLPVLRTCAISTAPFLNGRLGELKLVPLDPRQTAFGQSTDTLTYFVSFTLTQRFRRGSILASFVRNEDAGTGTGRTTILNSVSARVAYRISDYWRFTATGVYTFRDSIGQLPFTDVSARQSTDGAAVDVAGNPLAEASLLIANTALSSFEQTITSVDASLIRQLSEHSFLLFRFRYYDQSQDTLGRAFATGFDNFTGGISYVYEFDPYKL